MLAPPPGELEPPTRGKVCSHRTTPPLVTVTNITLTGKMGMQPILPVTMPIKKIKVATRQCYGDADGVVRCEQTSTVSSRCGGNSRLYFSKFYLDMGIVKVRWLQPQRQRKIVTLRKKNSDIEKEKIKRDP